MKRRRFLKAAGLGTLLLGGGGAASVSAARATNSYYDGPVTDHFDGTVFFNPQGEPPKGFKELIKWQLGGGRKRWPSAYPSTHSDEPPASVDGDGLRVSFVGHATVLVQTGGLNLLTDPVWSQRASPFQWAGPKRVNDPGIDFERLPKIDAVLLSHNHYDHLDLDTLSRLRRAHDPLVVTPLGNDTIIASHDAAIRTVTGDWGDTVELGAARPGAGVRVTFEPMHHWSARGIADRRNALWAAFVIDAGAAGKIYHIGDTGFHDGINYRDAKAKHGPFRLAILPFGAYEPRGFMRAQHQNPDEAVRGHLLCGAEQTLGHHWGTFQLTNEAIEDQLADLETARETHGVPEHAFRALRPGQAWDVPVRAALSA